MNQQWQTLSNGLVYWPEVYRPACTFVFHPGDVWCRCEPCNRFYTDRKSCEDITHSWHRGRRGSTHRPEVWMEYFPPLPPLSLHDTHLVLDRETPSFSPATEQHWADLHRPKALMFIMLIGLELQQTCQFFYHVMPELAVAPFLPLRQTNIIYQGCNQQFQFSFSNRFSWLITCVYVRNKPR